MQTGKFRYFDFGGSRKNLEEYGQDTPPEINISDITDVPVAMFVGRQDDLANLKDNRWLKEQLPSLIYYQEMDGSHASFVTGSDMDFFKRVCELAHFYNPITN